MKRPVFQPHERGLITRLAAVLPRWREALLLVKPEMVLRWHSEGFRLLWRWKSKPTKPPAPRVSPDVVDSFNAWTQRIDFAVLSVFAASSSSLGFTLRNARSNSTCEQACVFREHLNSCSETT